MDLPIKRIALANVNFNDDGTIDIIDCSYQTKLIHLEPVLENCDYVILTHRKISDTYQVFKVESNYYFENLSRYSILEAIREKLEKYQIEVKDLGLLYNTELDPDSWYFSNRPIELKWEAKRVTYQFKH
jgi:hypothetical protein